MTTEKRATRKPIAFYPIEDNDPNSIKHFNENGVPIRTITLNGVKHLYALIEVDTQEEADLLNREFNRLSRQASRQKKRQNEHEQSYDALKDDGYDAAIDDNDPFDIVSDMLLLESLFKEFSSLSSENKSICRMLAAQKTERDIAIALGIPQTTLHDRKAKLLKMLKSHLR